MKSNENLRRQGLTIWSGDRSEANLISSIFAIFITIFQDLYTRAGNLRKVDITKGNMFWKVMFLESQSDVIFGEIKKDNYLEDLAYDAFVKRLAYHFSEINALHPFREGNGRSQREFIRELALYNHYAIDFRKADEKEMLDASVDSFFCRYGKMEELFTKCQRKIK